MPKAKVCHLTSVHGIFKLICTVRRETISFIDEISMNSLTDRYVYFNNREVIL